MCRVVNKIDMFELQEHLHQKWEVRLLRVWRRQGCWRCRLRLERKRPARSSVRQLTLMRLTFLNYKPISVLIFIFLFFCSEWLWSRPEDHAVTEEDAMGVATAAVINAVVGSKSTGHLRGQITESSLKICPVESPGRTWRIWCGAPERSPLPTRTMIEGTKGSSNLRRGATWRGPSRSTTTMNCRGGRSELFLTKMEDLGLPRVPAADPVPATTSDRLVVADVGLVLNLGPAPSPALNPDPSLDRGPSPDPSLALNPDPSLDPVRDPSLPPAILPPEAGRGLALVLVPNPELQKPNIRGVQTTRAEMTEPTKVTIAIKKIRKYLCKENQRTHILLG